MYFLFSSSVSSKETYCSWIVLSFFNMVYNIIHIIILYMFNIKLVKYFAAKPYSGLCMTEQG